VFGGVTRALLARLPAPILMAHWSADQRGPALAKRAEADAPRSVPPRGRRYLQAWRSAVLPVSLHRTPPLGAPGAVEHPATTPATAQRQASRISKFQPVGRIGTTLAM